MVFLVLFLCPCIVINNVESVQYDGGSLPDIILLTLCDIILLTLCYRGIRLYAMERFFLAVYVPTSTL